MGKQNRRYAKLRAELFFKQGGKCCYCRRLMVGHHTGKNPRRPTIEHLHRRADGGTDRRDNMALACYSCNINRGTLDWLTYASLKQGELVVAWRHDHPRL